MFPVVLSNVLQLGSECLMYPYYGWVLSNGLVVVQNASVLSNIPHGNIANYSWVLFNSSKNYSWVLSNAPTVVQNTNYS